MVSHWAVLFQVSVTRLVVTVEGGVRGLMVLTLPQSECVPAAAPRLLRVAKHPVSGEDAARSALPSSWLWSCCMVIVFIRCSPSG